MGHLGQTQRAQQPVCNSLHAAATATTNSPAKAQICPHLHPLHSHSSPHFPCTGHRRLPHTLSMCVGAANPTRSLAGHGLLNPKGAVCLAAVLPIRVRQIERARQHSKACWARTHPHNAYGATKCGTQKHRHTHTSLLLAAHQANSHRKPLALKWAGNWALLLPQ